ncbi:MAG TPA: hypothetical protein VNK04_25560 [Gemmataceae bacterium]|nr:hypothetical protein [Gemmataceae bacterium]
MNEPPLSRVPFRADEEAMIASMARWMRFIAVYTIIVGFLLFFVVLVIAVFLSVAQGAEDRSLARAREFIEAHAAPLIVLVAAALAAAVVVTWSGFVLYQAGDNFSLVARTDLADQDYLARGFEKLRVYYMIQVLTVVFFVIIALLVVFSTVLRGTSTRTVNPGPAGPHGGSHVTA